MSGDELVWTVPRELVLPDGAWRGVRAVDLAATLALVSAAGRFVPRAAAEQDPGRKQIVPYLVLRDGERLFLMRRSRAGTDPRLHDRYSIGVGGHLNPGDAGVLGCLRREWHEELVAGFEPEPRYVGLLNDDTSDVGAVHLGVVFEADAAGRSVAVRETDKLSGSFESMERLQAVEPLMETWSQLVLAHLVRPGP